MYNWAERPLHRILVYTEHGLTQDVVEGFFASCEGDVYDPFVGSGTVGVESLFRGRRFIGADSNPAAVVTSAAKVNPEMRVRLVPLLGELARYYDATILEALVDIARRVSTSLEAGAFFSVARKFSRFRFTPAPRFGRGIKGNPEEEYEALLERARSDVELLGARRGDVVLADSTAWVPRRVRCILTSPPFANNVDYVRHTMLELLWLGVPPSRARDLQLPACEAAARSWKPTVKVDLSIGGRRAKGYRKFLGQYLYHMERHLELLASALEGEAWYTIGDSILGGAYVPTHRLLAISAEQLGLRVKLQEVGDRARPGRRLYLLIMYSRK